MYMESGRSNYDPLFARQYREQFFFSDVTTW